MGWKEFGDWAFLACAVVAVLFAVLYLFSAPWWTTPTGRNIMALMGSVALAFTYFAWVIQIGGVPYGFYPIRAMLFVGIATSIGWRVAILVKSHIIPSLTSGRRGERSNVEDSR